MAAPLSHPEPITTQRLEAFSDGVFAIAITLLVLDFKAPHPADGASLAGDLRRLWPAYLGYTLSFVMIGIYWLNHHYVFRLITRTDHWLSLLNLIFLMCISFLPFPTAVLSGHIGGGADARTAVMFYVLGLLLPAASFTAVWEYASRRATLVDARLTPEFVWALRLQHAASVAIYAGLLAAAAWRPLVGLVACVALTLLYAMPLRPPRYREPAVQPAS